MCVFLFLFLFSFPLKLTQSFTFSWKSSGSGFPVLESHSFLSVSPGKFPLTSLSWFRDHRQTGRVAKRGEMGDMNKNENIPDVSSKSRTWALKRTLFSEREQRPCWVCIITFRLGRACIITLSYGDSCDSKYTLLCENTKRMQVTTETKNSLDCKAHAAEIRKLALL